MASLGLHNDMVDMLKDSATTLQRKIVQKRRDLISQDPQPNVEFELSILVFIQQQLIKEFELEEEIPWGVEEVDNKTAEYYLKDFLISEETGILEKVITYALSLKVQKVEKKRLERLRKEEEVERKMEEEQEKKKWEFVEIEDVEEDVKSIGSFEDPESSFEVLSDTSSDSEDVEELEDRESSFEIIPDEDSDESFEMVRYSTERTTSDDEYDIVDL